MSYLNEDDIKRLAEDKCCGACKHWHRWDLQREIEYWNSYPNHKKSHDESSLHFGDCDKFKDAVTFEDESYADEYRCFKLRKKVRKNNMGEQKLRFEDDKLYVYTPIPQLGEGTYKKELVMDKDTFIKCFEKWVKEEGEEV